MEIGRIVWSFCFHLSFVSIRMPLMQQPRFDLIAAKWSEHLKHSYHIHATKKLLLRIKKRWRSKRTGENNNNISCTLCYSHKYHLAEKLLKQKFHVLFHSVWKERTSENCQFIECSNSPCFYTIFLFSSISTETREAKPRLVNHLTDHNYSIKTLRNYFKCGTNYLELKPNQN